MTAKSKYRGHAIEFVDDKWVYPDTGQPVADTHESRACGNCDRPYTTEGHDGCLGTLPGVMNACCGHGDIVDAYVQFLDGFSIHGPDAITILEILKKMLDKLSKVVYNDR